MIITPMKHSNVTPIKQNVTPVKHSNIHDIDYYFPPYRGEAKAHTTAAAPAAPKTFALIPFDEIRIDTTPAYLVFRALASACFGVRRNAARVSLFSI